MFDDGELKVYTKKYGKSSGGRSIVESIDLFAEHFFGEIGFTTEEYYSARQADVSIERRVRIRQDKTICNKHAIVIGDTQYDVGRVYSAVVKGIPVTDITLEKVTAVYNIPVEGFEEAKP